MKDGDNAVTQILGGTDRTAGNLEELIDATNYGDDDGEWAVSQRRGNDLVDGAARRTAILDAVTCNTGCSRTVGASRL